MHGTQLRTYGTSTNYSDICSAHVVSRGKFDNQSRGRVETSGWNKWLLHHGKLELDTFGDGSFDDGKLADRDAQSPTILKDAVVQHRQAQVLK